MSRYRAPDRADGSAPTAPIGILLLNLGTPAAPTSAAVRAYLAQFLSDPRVIEAPSWLWWPLLHGYVLRRRPAQSARAYARIWRDDGSPLLVWTERLAAALRKALARPAHPHIPVAIGMTYGVPSTASALHKLLHNGVEKVLVLPLFPQYSATSTGAALDAACRALLELRRMPAIQTITSYATDAGYVGALAASVEAHWKANGRGSKLLLSFHGIPQQYADAGDPYPAQCQATASHLGELLSLDKDELLVTFQSRLGRHPWLQPYTDKTVERLGKQKLASLDVLCPGFAVDCLETLEEVALRYRATFLAAGGGQFRYIPALNDAPEHVSALAAIVLRGLGVCRTYEESAANPPVRSILPPILDR